MSLPTWQIVVIAVGLGLAVVRPKPIVQPVVKTVKVVSHVPKHVLHGMEKAVGK